MVFLEWLGKNHFMQFLLALVLLVLYFITYNAGNPSVVLEQLAIVSTSFFFVQVVQTKSNDSAIASFKAASQEVKSNVG